MRRIEHTAQVGVTVIDQITIISLRSIATIHSRHANALGRLQLLFEVARLGRDYVPVLKMIDGDKPGLPMLEAYAKEQSPEFYDLHALVTVRMWSILEAFVRDISCFLLAHVPAVREQDAIAKLKGPILKFISSSGQEQADYLYELLETSISAALKPGVGRFESVLSSLGYGGPVDDQVRNGLFHCSKLRNCIVHNDGIVDRDLLTACPRWRGTAGTRIGITASMSRKHFYAICWYMMEVERRLLPSNFERMPQLLDEQRAYLEAMDKAGNPGSYPFGGSSVS